MKEQEAFDTVVSDRARLARKLKIVRDGLAAVLHILDGNPELVIPAKSLVETMIKIVDE